MGCNAPGVECRTAGEQGGFQAAAMLVAVAMGVFGGFATGALVRGVAFDPQSEYSSPPASSPFLNLCLYLSLLPFPSRLFPSSFYL